MAHAISSAAGPAGENLWRLGAGLPALDLGDAAWAGDRKSIEKIAELTGHQADGWQEMVWRIARGMLERPTIWRAVAKLAARLAGLWPASDEPGTFDVEMAGSEATAIIRDALHRRPRTGVSGSAKGKFAPAGHEGRVRPS